MNTEMVCSCALVLITEFMHLIVEREFWKCSDTRVSFICHFSLTHKTMTLALCFLMYLPIWLKIDYFICLKKDCVIHISRHCMVWTGSRSHGDRRHRESIHASTDDCRLHGAYNRAKPSPFSSDLHTLHSCTCGCVHVPSVKVQWERDFVVVTCHVLMYSSIA